MLPKDYQVQGPTLKKAQPDGWRLGLREGKLEGQIEA